jgi:hypothetical protein
MNTFNITSTLGGQMYTRTNVNQFLRVNLTDMGGASSITFAIIACYKGVTEPSTN